MNASGLSACFTIFRLFRLIFGLNRQFFASSSEVNRALGSCFGLDRSFMRVFVNVASGFFGFLPACSQPNLSHTTANSGPPNSGAQPKQGQRNTDAGTTPRPHVHAPFFFRGAKLDFMNAGRLVRSRSSRAFVDWAVRSFTDPRRAGFPADRRLRSPWLRSSLSERPREPVRIGDVAVRGRSTSCAVLRSGDVGAALGHTRTHHAVTGTVTHRSWCEPQAPQHIARSSSHNRHVLTSNSSS